MSVAFNSCAPGTDYGDIAKQDLILNTRWNSYYLGQYAYYLPNQRVPVALSYVPPTRTAPNGWGWSSLA